MRSNFGYEPSSNTWWGKVGKAFSLTNRLMSSSPMLLQASYAIDVIRVFWECNLSSINAGRFSKLFLGKAEISLACKSLERSRCVRFELHDHSYSTLTFAVRCQKTFIYAEIAAACTNIRVTYIYSKVNTFTMKQCLKKNKTN